MLGGLYTNWIAHFEKMKNAGNDSDVDNDDGNDDDNNNNSK
jgi:hypothetical protein